MNFQFKKRALKNLTFVAIISALLVGACKKDTPVSTCPAPPTPKPDNTPFSIGGNDMITDSWEIGKAYYGSGPSHLSSDSSYTNLFVSNSSGGSTCNIYFKGSPTVTTNYSCVNKPLSTLSTSECIVKIDVNYNQTQTPAKPREHWISTSGTLLVKVRGKGIGSSATISYNKVYMQDSISAKIDTASGFLNTGLY
jgi:hypothetical protein